MVVGCMQVFPNGGVRDRRAGGVEIYAAALP
jgi:hypothetical protein